MNKPVTPVSHLLADVTTDYDVRLDNKKQASRTEEGARRLQAAGYRIPSHWKNAAIDRPFIAWDGEGITSPGMKAQDYVLFGASTGDRVSKPSLGTTDCLDLLLSVEATHPNAIHVGFALQYDCNMIFKDLSRRHLYQIYKRHRCYWYDYRIEYRPGKWLSIRKGNIKVRLFDVFGYFQASFVTACEKFLGKDDPELDAIRTGKNARKSFTYDQLEPFIVPYWEGELRLLVRLMDSLRDDLTNAGLSVASWHGPGAIANGVFRSKQTGAVMAKTPVEVNRAAQYGYAGGRFELFQCGHYPNTVWEYDINSAYPAAIAGLPNLASGSWRATDSFQPDSFGIWRVIRDDSSKPSAVFGKPQPLFVRDEHGNVSYPPIADGWYWTPEAETAKESVIGGFVLEHDGTKPFAFVEAMYEQRREWKQQGNSAERALKLALNSLYGKMAQRAGWMQEGDPLPRWHQLEWAGYVTSQTRRRLWDAISLKPNSVIAVETDALFTLEALPTLPIGEELGQWSVEQFDWITYLQNGLYYAGREGEVIERYRGFDKGSLPYGRVMEYLREMDGGKRTKLRGETTRFVGLGVALHTRATWRSWVTDQREVLIGGGGKRAHIKGVCSACRDGVPMAEGLHPLTVVTAGGRSHPHSLPWLAGAESELRRIDELARW